MISKDILINVSLEEIRVAIKEDNELTEYFTENFDKKNIVGNIYLGKVNKILQGINASFVNIGFKNDAFLHFSDVDESMEQNFLIEDDDEDEVVVGKTNVVDSEKKAFLLRKAKPQFKSTPKFQTKKSGEININLNEGQDVIVQVTREAYSNKGVKVTTKVAIPGRYMVLLPFDNLLGVSKKISSFQERKRLRSIVRNEAKNSGYGCIIRTAAKGKNEEDFIADWNYLVNIWKEIENKIEHVKSPTILYQDLNLAKSIVRDYLTSNVNSIIIDSPNFYREILHYVENFSPKYAHKIKLHSGKLPIFEHYDIDSEIKKLFLRKIPMASGASIVIDSTEAMTVVDVNSGRSVDTEQEKTSLNTNLEALKEIAKQLKLRDVGGIIIVDFIDMYLEVNRKRVFNEMRDELYKDKAKTIVYPLTQLGLMQMTRQRINQNLSEKISEICPTCNGIGRIPSKSLIINYIESWLKKFRFQSRELRVLLMVHPHVARELTDGSFSKMSQLMVKYFLRIKLVSNDALNHDEFKFYSIKRQKEITKDFK